MYTRMLSSLLLSGLLILTACAADPFASTPSTIVPDTSTPTATVSIAQLTAAATFRPTLPASFTPTFTPTITATPSPTFTPSPTLTTTTVPEDILCDALEVDNTFINEDEQMSLSDVPKVWRVYIPYDTSTIDITVTDSETGDFIANDQLLGGEVWTVDFRAGNFPDAGTYTWTLTISDRGRDGLCEQSNTFETTEDDSVALTPSPVASDTGDAAESTAQVIIVTATPESTADVIIITATPESTIGTASTEASEATAEVIPVLPPSATPTRVPFPPR